MRDDVRIHDINNYDIELKNLKEKLNEAKNAETNGLSIF